MNVEDIVKNGKCISCMACISMCKFGDELEIENCGFGYPVPKKHENCDDCGICLLECLSAEDND